jgi:GDP-L-fucose synthase
MAFEAYNKPDPVNIGSGNEISIAELVTKIKKLIGYKGDITWDKRKPDGQPRRLLDTQKALQEFNFKARINFDDGLKSTISWYLKNYAK